jgi:SAM-dependent methyltransferase
MGLGMSAFQYVGDELSLFAEAHRWKSYWRGRIAPYVRGDVLEVGAGIGANTVALAGLTFERWTSLEPDAALAAQIPRPSRQHRVVVGTLDDVDGAFDALLYLDVLEHIADDRGELARASARLAVGGTLVILAPAHPWLYTPFDRAVGHHRRYTRGALRAIAPASLREVELCYLDAAGMLASIGNRFMLRAAMPSRRQIAAWDRWLVPCSRWLDTATGGHVGKSVLGAWRRA